MRRARIETAIAAQNAGGHAVERRRAKRPGPAFGVGSYTPPVKRTIVFASLAAVTGLSFALACWLGDLFPPSRVDPGSGLQHVGAESEVSASTAVQSPIERQPIDHAPAPSSSDAAEGTVRISGTITEDRDRAVAGASIRVRARGHRSRTMHRLGGCRADSHGRFEVVFASEVFEQLNLEAPFEVEFTVRGRVIRDPIALKIASLPATREVDIVVVPFAELPCVSGTVVSATGGPIVGARVVRKTRRGGGRAVSITDENGRFELDSGRADASKPVRLYVTHAWHHALESPGAFSWGTSDIELVMRRRETFTLRVDDGAGVAVETFGVVWFPAIRPRRGLDVDHDVRFDGVHEDGRLELPIADVCEHQLVVIPGDARYFLSRPRKLYATPGGEARVSLTRSARCAIELRGPEDVAVAGATIEALFCIEEGERVSIGSSAHPISKLSAGRLSANAALRLGETLTDEQGNAVLRLPLATEFSVRVRAPNYEPRVFEVAVDDPATPLRFVLRKGAALDFRIGPPDLVGMLIDAVEHGAEPPHVILLPPEDSSDVGYGEAGFAALQRDGRCTVSGVPEGEWAAYLFGARLYGAHRWSPSHTLLTTVKCFDGMRLTRSFDLSELRASPVEFDLRLWSGEPARNSNLYFEAADTKLAESPAMTSVSANADGRVRTWLRRGSYVVRVADNSPKGYAPAARLEVTASGADRSSILVGTRSLRFRLENYRNQTLHGVHEDLPWSCEVRIVESGEATVRGVPYGSIRWAIRSQPNSDSTSLGALEVPVGDPSKPLPIVRKNGRLTIE